MRSVNPIVIVGAGASGLAVAASLRARGLRARLLDRHGVTGGAYREMPATMELVSPTALNALPGLAIDGAGEYMTAAGYAAYLGRYADHHGLAAERAEVHRITRAPRGARGHAGFEVHLASGDTISARAVVVASGMWDYPVSAPLPLGPPLAVMHSRAWRGAAAHPQRALLVVGGGMSGVETAVELARAGRRVWLSSRRSVELIPRAVLGVDLHHIFRPLERFPVWLATRHCTRPRTFQADRGFSELVRAGRIALRGPVIGSVGHTVHFAHGSPASVELVVLATGFTYATPFLPAEVARMPSGQPRARRCQSVSWPGLFIVGMRCVGGIDSEFLRGIARDVRQVAQTLVGRA